MPRPEAEPGLELCAPRRSGTLDLSGLRLEAAPPELVDLESDARGRAAAGRQPSSRSGRIRALCPARAGARRLGAGRAGRALRVPPAGAPRSPWDLPARVLEDPAPAKRALSAPFGLSHGVDPRHRSVAGVDVSRSRAQPHRGRVPRRRAGCARGAEPGEQPVRRAPGVGGAPTPARAGRIARRACLLPTACRTAGSRRAAHGAVLWRGARGGAGASGRALPEPLGQRSRAPSGPFEATRAARPRSVGLGARRHRVAVEDDATRAARSLVLQSPRAPGSDGADPAHARGRVGKSVHERRRPFSAPRVSGRPSSSSRSPGARR